MQFNKIAACLSLAFISTLSVNAHALDVKCLYQQYPTMTKTWGTVTTTTSAEKSYYDKFEITMSFWRVIPSYKSAGSSKTFYNFETVPQVKAWFKGVNNDGEWWAINPIAIGSLLGENDPLQNKYDHCGPTGEERIIR